MLHKLEKLQFSIEGQLKNIYILLED